MCANTRQTEDWRAYKLFAFTSVLLSITTLVMDLFAQDDTLDITVHDTYIVIAKFHIWILLILFTGTITALYYLMYKMNRKINTMLTYAHYLSTFYH